MLLEGLEVMNATTLNHLHLAVSDQKRSTDFYDRYFGFRVDFQLPDSASRPAIFLRNEAGFQLALENHPDRRELPAWFHLGFRVPSADACRQLYGRMADAGVKILDTLRDSERYVTFTCADPDGYHLQVYWDSH